ncbi:unnamed protein product [Sphagnum jensenii]
MLIESTAGDTENVMTHHSSVGNISRRFCSVHSRIGRRYYFKKLSKRPSRLYDNVDLMRRTPNAQHVVISTRNDEGDKNSEAANHRSLVIRRHADQLGALISI